MQKLIHQLNLQDKIFLPGIKKDPFAGIEDADLLLMGSDYEGSPNVLPEAGVLGIPVIAFNVPGGINEIITDGENGLLVNNNDEKAFTIAIEKALQINFDRDKITDITKNRFSISAAIAKTEALFLLLTRQH